MLRSYPVMATYIDPIGTMVPRPKNERSNMLPKKIIMVVLLSLITGTLMAQEAKVTSLVSKDLKDFPGKEGLMIAVEYRPELQTLSIVTMHTHLYTCWRAPSSCS
jgi:hypothetical protein